MSATSFRKQLTISSEHHGQRLDTVLAILFPQFSRSQFIKWIKEGTIKKNRMLAKPKDKVVIGDQIEIDVQFSEINNQFHLSQPQDIPLEMIYEDDDILVINKPAGLVVHPGAGNPDTTLVNALLHHYPDLKLIPRAGIIHRLDKDTTGLLIIAKSLPAHTNLVQQMQERLIKRRYKALVQGRVLKAGSIHTQFGRHPVNRLKMAVVSNGKEAITQYDIEYHFHDFSLVDVELMTGRTHQIRVHMAHIHHPIVGDPLYGKRNILPKHADETLKELLKNFKRQALHAYSLSFKHPVTNHLLTLTCPLPDDFQYLLDQLRQHYENLKS